jgi:hypothetical protein
MRLYFCIVFIYLVYHNRICIGDGHRKFGIYVQLYFNTHTKTYEILKRRENNRGLKDIRYPIRKPTDLTNIHFLR